MKLILKILFAPVIAVLAEPMTLSKLVMPKSWSNVKMSLRFAAMFQWTEMNVVNFQHDQLHSCPAHPL